MLEDFDVSFSPDVVVKNGPHSTESSLFDKEWNMSRRHDADNCRSLAEDLVTQWSEAEVLRYACTTESDFSLGIEDLLEKAATRKARELEDDPALFYLLHDTIYGDDVMFTLSPSSCIKAGVR